MPTIADIRQQYPQYQDLPDEQLAQGLHQKFYSDMPFEDFSAKIGLGAPAQIVSNPAGKVGAMEDVAKSVGSNLVGGAIDIGMTLPNVLNQAVTGPQLLGRSIAENVDKLIGIQPQPRGELWQPFFGSYDVEKALGSNYEPQTTAGKVVALPARIAGGVGGAKTLQSAYSKGAKAMEPKITSDDFGDKANAAYQNMRNNGATLNKNGIDEVTSSVDNNLKNSGLMNERLHGDTLSVVKDLNDEAATGSMDLEKLDQYRQLLNQVVRKNIGDPDAFKAQQAINALDDAVNSLGAKHLSSGTPDAISALNEGRKYYAASARLTTVENILNDASNAPNAQTAIKGGFRSLSKTLQKNPRGWSEDEVKAVNHAAKTGLLTGALKTIGSKFVSGIVGGAGGAAGGGWPGAMIGAAAGEAAGFPMRAAADALQASRANNVSDAIINRIVNPATINFPSLASTVGVTLPLEDLRQRLNR